MHQHLWPEAFVAALRARSTPPLIDGRELTTSEGRFVLDLGQHDLDTRIRTLDRDEIDVGVVSLQTSALAATALALWMGDLARRALIRGRP
jgi:hypothetical protein